MTVTLATVSAVLGLSGICFTVAGYINARREASKRSTLLDIEHIRPLIGQFMFGAKSWQTYLGVALTAGGVVFGAAADIVGATCS